MITVFKILGRIGLLLTLVPAILYFFDSIELSSVKFYMTIGMIAWFAGSIVAGRLKPAESE